MVILMQLLAGGGVYVSAHGLGINTDLTDMISDDLAFHRRWKEYKEQFPDIDDTIMVLMALHDLKFEGDENSARLEARVRGLGWILSLQSKNGEWGSFDKDNTKSFLTKLPFADHNAMIDPPTADRTSRTLECLVQYGFTKSDECVRDAISFRRPLLRHGPEAPCHVGGAGIRNPHPATVLARLSHTFPSRERGGCGKSRN